MKENSRPRGKGGSGPEGLCCQKKNFTIFSRLNIERLHHSTLDACLIIFSFEILILIWFINCLSYLSKDLIKNKKCHSQIRFIQSWLMRKVFMSVSNNANRHIFRFIGKICSLSLRKTKSMEPFFTVWVFFAVIPTRSCVHQSCNCTQG